MLKKLVVTAAAIMIFMVVPALGQNAGCKNGKFVGTYTLADPNFELFSTPPSVTHSLVYQLTFSSDGTAHRTWTGFPDYFINLGTGSDSIGSWKCRQDGKVVATLISAQYLPVPPNSHPEAPSADVRLTQTNRTTYLYEVTDDNTLTQIQRVNRRYTPAQDPTDPNGGTLGAVTGGSFAWKRLTVSENDLITP